MLWVTTLKDKRNDDRFIIITDRTPFVPPGGALADFNSFRHSLYSCLTHHVDTFFELADAVVCATGPVTKLAHLSLQPEHHRGHGSQYAGVIDTNRLRRLLATTPIPTITGPDGRRRIVLAVDVSNWLRPDAATSPDRSFYHSYARAVADDPRLGVLLCGRA